ncbi:MAG: SpoIID/LytB domain-containing protein [Deltaproteobacteria bacterium]|nr:SpoIID/LytB domain-containing protein [Deltaproteobacteria bacterium]
MLAILLVAASVGAAPVVVDGGEMIRIAVGRFADTLIEGAGVVVVGVDGAALATPVGPLSKVRVQAGKSGLLIGGKAAGRDVVVVRAPLLKLAGHSYRGVLEVRYQLYDKKPELLIVHPLDLETYVTGIVSAELPRGWPLASYQAQAVAARTFAMTQKMRRIDLPYHMETTVLDQVYGGVEREHALAEEAARTTRGQILSFRRHVAQTYFHASCGGRTESAKEGWGTPLGYLPGSPCNKCDTASRSHWSVKIPRADVDRAFLRVAGGPITALKITETTASKRAKTVELRTAKKTTTITGADFRRLLGWSVVWSTQIDKLELTSTTLAVEGRGSGHGVGLCQWGSRGFALAGVPYDKILATYYPGARLARLY